MLLLVLLLLLLLLQSIPSVESAAADTLTAMSAHGVTRAALMGHSYGTTIGAVLVKSKPEVVHTLAMIDPVSEKDENSS
jgi:pimeloyl-ACP methyl ester carboxylesterase